MICFRLPRTQTPGWLVDSPLITHSPSSAKHFLANEDFTEPQLRKILDSKLKDQDLVATDMAKQVASDLLNRAKNRPNFGNSGEVGGMLGLAKSRYQKRQASVPPDQRSDVIFEAEDFNPDWGRGRNAAGYLAKLFEDLVGGDDIVKKLGDYQKCRISATALREMVGICVILTMR
jgi:hypothetical protein